MEPLTIIFLIAKIGIVLWATYIVLSDMWLKKKEGTAGILVAVQDEDGLYFSLELDVMPEEIIKQNKVTFNVRKINSSSNGTMLTDKKGEQNG